MLFLISPRYLYSRLLLRFYTVIFFFHLSYKMFVCVIYLQQLFISCWANTVSSETIQAFATEEYNPRDDYTTEGKTTTGALLNKFIARQTVTSHAAA